MRILLLSALTLFINMFVVEKFLSLFWFLPVMAHKTLKIISWVIKMHYNLFVGHNNLVQKFHTKKLIPDFFL